MFLTCIKKILTLRASFLYNMLMLRGVLLFFVFTAFVFLLSVVTLRAADNCGQVAQIVKNDGQETSFYDRRALQLYKSNKLKHGVVYQFLAKYWGEIKDCS